MNTGNVLIIIHHKLCLNQSNHKVYFTACADATLSLSKIPDEPNTNSWHLTLSHNEISDYKSIIKQTTPQRVEDYPTGQVLNCDEFRKFWVEWADR